MDFSGVILLVLVVITLFINQFFKIKEIAILLFGFVLVYFYFFSYYFFTDNLCEWMLSFKNIHILGIFDDKLFTRTSTIISLVFLSILYVFFMIRTAVISESKSVAIRKKTFTLNTWSALMIACLFISNSTYPYVLGYFFVPISGYLSIFSQARNPFYFNELITLSVLLVLWL
jgi:hypothetical protein